MTFKQIGKEGPPCEVPAADGEEEVMERRDFFRVLAGAALLATVPLLVGFPTRFDGNDDWRFIQGLIDDAERCGLSRVDIPHGTYRCDRTVVLSDKVVVHGNNSLFVDDELPRSDAIFYLRSSNLLKSDGLRNLMLGRA